MEPEHHLQESFVLEADLGIFVMIQVSDAVYEGQANGFLLNICTEKTRSGFRYEANLICVDDSRDVMPFNTSGSAVSTSDLCGYLSSWMDTCCSEIISDYQKDAEYLDFGDRKTAFWRYNTHLDTTPVIFVHGGPGGDSNPVKARRLHLRNPVYLYDQRGCGMSTPEKVTWDAEFHGKELADFIDRLGLEKVILIGASWGSAVCVMYAHDTKCGKIEAMVLPSPYLSTAKWTEDMYLNLKDMGEDYYEKARELIGNKNFGEEFRRLLGDYNAKYLFNRKDFREIAYLAAEEEPPEVFRVLNGPNDMYCDGVLRDFDISPCLSEITVPVLFMCADSDEVRIERVLEYKNAVKGSRLSVIPHAGHVLATEQFASYRDAIQSFFRENGLSG